MRYVLGALLALVTSSGSAAAADLSMKLVGPHRIVAGKVVTVSAIGHPSGAPDTQDVWIAVGRALGNEPCPGAPDQPGAATQLTGSQRGDGSYVAYSGLPWNFDNTPGRFAVCAWLMESRRGGPQATASARLPYVVHAPRRVLRVRSPFVIHDRQLVAIRMVTVTDFEAELTIMVLRAGLCPHEPSDLVPDARVLKHVVFEERIPSGRHRLTRYAQFGRVPEHGRICVWEVQRDAVSEGPDVVARASRPFRRAARARIATAGLTVRPGRVVAGGETSVHYVYTGPHAGDPDWSLVAIGAAVLRRCPSATPDYTNPQWPSPSRAGRESGRITVGNRGRTGHMVLCVWAWKQRLDGSEKTPAIHVSLPIVVRPPVARLRLEAPSAIRAGHVFGYRVHVVTNLPAQLTVIALRAGDCPRDLANLVYDDRILRRMYSTPVPSSRVLHLYGIFRHMPAQGHICAWLDQTPLGSPPQRPYRTAMARWAFRRA